MSVASQILSLSILAEFALLYSCWEIIRHKKIEFSGLQISSSDKPVWFTVTLTAYWLVVTAMLIFINL